MSPEERETQEAFDTPVTGRADTPEKKKAVLEALAMAWETYPELRLGQLLTNSLYHVPSPRPCFFFVEDEPLQEALEKYTAGEPFPEEEK